jgi:hypothetical protein
MQCSAFQDHIRKLRRASAGKHRRGSSTARYNSSVIRSIREALAQDDDFVGIEKSGSVSRKREKIKKKSQALRMTTWGSLKMEKVTGFQDDGFVGV